VRAVQRGMLPVHLAVLGGHRRVARQLLTAGTVLGPADNLMGRFFHTLAAQGDVETMKTLLAAGLHVDITDTVRGTACTFPPSSHVAPTHMHCP